MPNAIDNVIAELFIIVANSEIVDIVFIFKSVIADKNEYIVFSSKSAITGTKPKINFAIKFKLSIIVFIVTPPLLFSYILDYFFIRNIKYINYFF